MCMPLATSNVGMSSKYAAVRVPCMRLATEVIKVGSLLKDRTADERPYARPCRMKNDQNAHSGSHTATTDACESCGWTGHPRYASGRSSVLRTRSLLLLSVDGSS